MRSSSPPPPESSALRQLARRIRALRERRGLTQEDFAARCAISVSFASLLERGERSPSHETLVQVAGALGVSLAELFQDEEDEATGAFRLVALVRERRLTRSQVEQLLAVAELLFTEGTPAPPPEPPAPRCEVTGCGRAVLARRLCVAHYHRARRARAATRG